MLCCGLTNAACAQKDFEMNPFLIALLVATTALSATAQTSRDVAAHEHGVTTLELAIEGRALEITLTAPGMDLVGFEHEAISTADKETVEVAMRLLQYPQNVLSLPSAASCHSQNGEANLADEGTHGHEEGHGHGGEHTGFSAQYAFVCDKPDALTEISFPYFQTFENAREIHILYVTEHGAGAAEAHRDAARISLQ